MRESGVLLHVTSLPGGRLGDEARRFVDWCVAAGQRWWQLLPLGPADEAGSPYRAASAFACSPALLADPDAPVSAAEIDRFVAAHPYWIGDWAAYAGEGAIADQVRFQREWSALRAYAAERDVRLIGDIPFYVAPGGADQLGRPELFRPRLLAGVPPDDWSVNGQLWGNPMYDWTAMRATGYRWWIERFRRTAELVDISRTDHFRAFVAGWGVPADRRTARRGRWYPAPGRALLEATRRALGNVPAIAEDLGVITPPVERLRDEFRLPGMVVLQFVFSAGMKNPQRAVRGPGGRVVYTGTHDNPTSAQWWAEASDGERARVRLAAAHAGAETTEGAWALIELALRSPHRLAIIPIQDVLELGADARMNTPGREGGNWSWRLDPGALDDRVAARMRAATAAAGRARAV
jgi:4-alpha-glucanotransferase